MCRGTKPRSKSRPIQWRTVETSDRSEQRRNGSFSYSSEDAWNISDLRVDGEIIDGFDDKFCKLLRGYPEKCQFPSNGCSVLQSVRSEHGLGLPQNEQQIEQKLETESSSSCCREESERDRERSSFEEETQTSINDTCRNNRGEQSDRNVVYVSHSDVVDQISDVSEESVDRKNDVGTTRANDPINENTHLDSAELESSRSGHHGEDSQDKETQIYSSAGKTEASLLEENDSLRQELLQSRVYYAYIERLLDESEKQHRHLESLLCKREDDILRQRELISELFLKLEEKENDCRLLQDTADEKSHEMLVLICKMYAQDDENRKQKHALDMRILDQQLQLKKYELNCRCQQEKRKPLLLKQAFHFARKHLKDAHA